jgi:hypothetical protein
MGEEANLRGQLRSSRPPGVVIRCDVFEDMETPALVRRKDNPRGVTRSVTRATPALVCGTAILQLLAELSFQRSNGTSHSSGQILCLFNGSPASSVQNLMSGVGHLILQIDDFHASKSGCPRQTSTECESIRKWRTVVQPLYLLPLDIGTEGLGLPSSTVTALARVSRLLIRVERRSVWPPWRYI